MRLRGFGVVVAFAVLMAGCAAAAPTPSPAPPVVVQTAESRFGPIVVDANGFSLYSYWDRNRGSICVAECAETWPPLIVTGDFAVAAGLDRSEFSVVARPDGGLQVKFGDFPLHRFVQDTQPGDTKGNGAFGVWYMIRGDGRRVVLENS